MSVVMLVAKAWAYLSISMVGAVGLALIALLGVAFYSWLSFGAEV